MERLTRIKAPRFMRLVADLVFQTDAAFKVSQDGGEAVWLPKSQCRHIPPNVFHAPEAMAMAKGLKPTPIEPATGEPA